MRFQTNSSEWIGEVKSYLTDSTKKLGEIKKCLRAVDFSNLSYEDKFRLSKLFDPTAEITGEAFKRQLDLYFSLLENKSAPINIPVFAEYVEWIYSQDPKLIPDKMFDLMTLRLAKSSATEIPEAVSSFMNNISQEYTRSIDRMSNERLGTLVAVLKEIGSDYDNLPKECKTFIRNIFIACAVKTEIADRNKKEFRGLFRDDPRTYYNWFNKAFAGFGYYETWIDEPAKKLTVKNMINYADMQDMVLQNDKRNLSFEKFQAYAKKLGLPRLVEYDSTRSGFKNDYLQGAREYKDYAKKLAEIFVQMIKSEVLSVTQKALDEELSNADVFALAPTQKMGRKIDIIRQSKTPYELGISYAKYLIELVHLDELTGQSIRDILNDAYLAEIQSKRPVKTIEETQKRNINIQGDSTYEMSALEIELSRQLEELYEQYYELAQQGKRNFSLEEQIINIEDQLKDLADEDLLSQPKIKES